MKKLIKLGFLCCCFFSFLVQGSEMVIDKNIFRKVPFSSQYSEDGALIRSVDFRAVNDLIPQIEKQFSSILKGRSLADRNESHITVITPPEGKTDFFPGSIGIDKVIPTSDLISMYKTSMQDTIFDIHCLGMQTNTKGNIVFFLVVKSSEILNLRKAIHRKVISLDPAIPFQPIIGYDPHITVGFIGGDVFGVSKGTDSCVSKIVIK